MIQLSIIIPHYNSPETLEVLLQSIPDIPEIEVLVIDDNSNLKLNVYSRCKRKFAERNISFYENAIESKGAGGARNIGLQYASGKWLLFADADDFFVENFWSKIQRYLNDESEIIYFSPVSVKLGTSVASDRHEYYMNLVKEYCKKGDLIGVRGRLQNKQVVYTDDAKLNTVEVVAERVTFLSSKKQD